MEKLLSQVRQCEICKAHLPLGPRPIISLTSQSRIVLVSQAPGKLAHTHHKAWDDPSGRRLREWLGVTDQQFYRPENFAILPMGFCYPGKGKTGDLPPRKECAPQWHPLVWEQLDDVKMVVVIGKYAQDYYLKQFSSGNLTANVTRFQDFLPKYFPLPHPSPVNRFWISKNPWFEDEVVPELRKRVAEIIAGN